jgi:hypothetical protein
MRNFTISKLFASVVTRVISVVAANGIATRSFRLTSMSEHMGYRIEERQPGSLSDSLWNLFLGNSLLGNSQPGNSQWGNKRPALQQPTLRRPALALAYDITAQSVCPAPRLSQARASWRG